MLEEREKLSPYARVLWDFFTPYHELAIKFGGTPTLRLHNRWGGDYERAAQWVLGRVSKHVNLLADIQAWSPHAHTERYRSTYWGCHNAEHAWCHQTGIYLIETTGYWYDGRNRAMDAAKILITFREIRDEEQKHD